MLNYVVVYHILRSIYIWICFASYASYCTVQLEYSSRSRVRAVCYKLGGRGGGEATTHNSRYRKITISGTTSPTYS